jgi:hypothetical protein
MGEWIAIHEATLWWAAGASVATLLAGVAIVPVLAIRIPADYFARRTRETIPWADRHPVLRCLLLVGKNLLGCVFLVAGMAMLVLPGPGVLTILVALTLVNFPGKFRLQRWIVARPPVLGTINWLRRGAGRAPLFLGE